MHKSAGERVSLRNQQQVEPRLSATKKLLKRGEPKTIQAAEGTDPEFQKTLPNISFGTRTTPEVP
jgi:hypothetical protein